MQRWPRVSPPTATIAPRPRQVRGGLANNFTQSADKAAAISLDLAEVRATPLASHHWMACLPACLLATYPPPARPLLPLTLACLLPAAVTHQVRASYPAAEIQLVGLQDWVDRDSRGNDGRYINQARPVHVLPTPPCVVYPSSL